jgi:RES domain-containing protein
VVEAQHRISTMKLVDTLAEQERLEQILEHSKPPVPPECEHLHYLLSTPFRYGAPYPQGSRFRRAGLTPGVFYGSRTATTAVIEMAFHRLLFFADSPDTPWPDNPGEYTAFSVRYRTAAGLDLTSAPLDQNRSEWTHPTDYAACQALADTARAAGVDVLRYASARDLQPPGGTNLALLTCRAFASRAPLERRTWRLHVDAAGVRAICAFPEARLGLDRDAFVYDPRMSTMRWERGRA